MLSRNNHQEQFKKYEPKKQRFTIKKLSVGVASVLLGISFANGVSADTTDANADANTNNGDGSEQTDHNLVLNSANNQTLKEATTANQASGAMPVSQNPAGDLKTPVADQFEQTVASAASQAIAQSTLANTNDSANASVQNTAQPAAANQDNRLSKETTADTQSFATQSFNVSNNATDLDNSAMLAQLFRTSLAAVPASEGTTNTTPVNLSTYNPNFNITNGKEYSTYFGNLPQTQIGFSQYRDITNNNVLTLATDKDNPGNNIYFYVNSKLATTIGKDEWTKPWNGPLTITQTNGNVYSGGTYKYSRKIVTFGGYKYTRINLENGNGMSPVDVPSTGAFTTSGSNLMILWGDGDPIAKSPVAQQRWNSGGERIPGKVQQTIWYVNADTGEVMAHKSSDLLVAGQHYDVSAASPAKVEYKGQVYDLINRTDGKYDSSELNEQVLNAVLTNNNGEKITVRDVINTPLEGKIGSSRKGNITVGTTDYGPSRIYVSQQLDDGGTISLNTYDIQPSDSTPGAMAATFVDAGNISAKRLPSVYTANTGDETQDAAAATAQGARSAVFNNRVPGNQDVVFLYRTPKAQEQKANVTFINDDTGVAISAIQTATGKSGETITFPNAAYTVADLEKTYTYNGTTGNGVVNGAASGSFTNVTFPVYDSDNDTTQSFVIHFKNKTPDMPTYHQGKEESVTVNRTINYYDKVTGAKIPSDLIATNPVKDSVIFTRTQVLDQNGKVVGYGTVSSDGKSFRTQDWHTAEGLTTDEFAAKKSADLSAFNYTAPEFQDGTSANVVAAHEVTPDTQNLEYNVYYGHQTQQVTTNQDVTRRFH